MKMKHHILLLSCAALLSPFATQAQAQTAATETAATESQKLSALFAADDEASLQRNPLSAMFRGDMRYADRFGDFISDAYFADERKAAETNLEALKSIDRDRLDATDKIAYDVFKQNQTDALKGLSKEIMDLTVVRPLNHFFGFHTFYPTFASGQGAAPFKTVQDYDNNLKRHKEFIILMDRSIDRFRQGMATGVFETKMTITNVVDQLNTQLAQKTEESPYYGPILKFPEGFSDADKARLTSEYRDIVENGLYPANARLRDFLRDSYLPLAREQVGLSAMKGGEGLYQYMIEQTTTLPLKADDIHNLGLSEVARITSGMEAIRKEVGFKGTLPEFFDHLRSDPKFKLASRDALTQGYYLPSRTTPGMTTLYLHEGAPGHHFQISIAQENEKLPAFMRFGGNTAYVEGWALYAETLGYDMGLYKDPYQRFGTLSDEMLRAMRLVVDTGLHSKDWTRQQAIDYMLANSDMGKTDATAEVERYIAIPTQALAYKIGALTIMRLRDKAKTQLGKKFDVREFHNQVLNTGALPLTVLEKKIDDWISASK